MNGSGAYGWLLLGLAVVLELTGTLSMKLSHGFTRLWPSVAMFICYAASFTSLNFALKYMQLSVAYAIWSGVGIVLIAVAGWLMFKQPLSGLSLFWMSIIITGVVGLNMSVK
ncbi:small multidrug resistance pump [Paenibacillus phyllosphaerae]|uniref:Small multidrug resistance pump n=1 Tax=Paenibacillus phyllosphaerae TaxID=274593 RepID=A0A7W5B220_9BACL|nr:multidrug efflux SMR transporter [Paenibacillus phyllosphaerae]MBB3112411.1 small multidrug resistance pump [Paenibacillus phyllosphaerae]